MEGRKLLLRIEETIERWIGETDTLLALRLQILVDQRGTACPEWSTGTGAADNDPAAARAP